MTKQHLSWSQLSKLSCLKRYEHEYIKNLQPIQFSPALNFGKYFHMGVEHINNGGMDIDSIGDIIDTIDTSSFNQEDFDKLDWMKTVVIAMLYGYYKHFYLVDKDDGIEILEAEQEYMYPIQKPNSKYKHRQYEYNFISDMVYKNKKGEIWIVEYKTTSRLGSGYFDRLTIDGQGKGMAYYLQKEFNQPITGISYRIMKKPSIRQKKSESRREFMTRLSHIFEEQAEDYFIEKKVFIDQNDLQSWAKDLWDQTKLVTFIKKNNIFPKDTSKCSILNCPFIPLCSNQANAEVLYKQKEVRLCQK